MATYEVEHSTAENNNTASSGTSRQPGSHRSTRPDLSTFFATLNEISPYQGEQRTRPHAVPVPGDVSAAFRSLAEAFDVMRRGGDNAPLPIYDGRDPEIGNTEQGPLIEEMIRALLQEAEAPPREVEGVSEEFCDMLDRIPTSKLKESQSCPICNNPFLEDSHPLVVRLPCHTSHLFDLETDFGKKERQKEQERLERLMKKSNGLNDDDDEEWDGMYA
ncbi:uncharacterized protein GIQ15_00848 [Arthroderma uncinatum]|uniref:uncharacterized protein n=1 Tax=Arthroderma uncinatum TaxID=74035 RepID=UPI00144AE451|nr:uncharacterized protein GIQ15_00848 [Arthroderma uncinatum]KAF3491331.1 hypothetical protein GIQ15_00848 [Arthroderma uncinatum]